MEGNLSYSKTIYPFLFFVCVFATNAKAQVSASQTIQRCDRALANIGARQAIPSFASPAVREAVCTCVKAGAPLGENQSQEEEAAESMQTIVAQCTASAVPAERVRALPVAVLGRLRDAIEGPDVPSGFITAIANLDDCKRPEYPQASLRSQASGDTLLAFKISASGKVLDGVVIRSAGPSAAHKLLDVTAQFALMQCKFEPAYWRRKAAESWTEVEYKWQLQ